MLFHHFVLNSHLLCLIYMHFHLPVFLYIKNDFVKNCLLRARGKQRGLKLSTFQSVGTLQAATVCNKKQKWGICTHEWLISRIFIPGINNGYQLSLALWPRYNCIQSCLGCNYRDDDRFWSEPSRFSELSVWCKASTRYEHLNRPVHECNSIQTDLTNNQDYQPPWLTFWGSSF